MHTIFLALLVLVALPVRAEFKIPPLTSPVVDSASLFSPSTRRRLQDFATRLRTARGTQLQVLSVSDLGGLTIEQASIKVTDEWRLGGAETDDGVLLLIARQEKQVRIEVGQGLEGVLPDVVASRIIREVITPNFRNNDFDRGVIEGVIAIVQRTDPEFLGQSYDKGSSGRKVAVSGRKIELIIFILFFTFMLLPALFGRRRGFHRRGVYGVFPGGIGWPPGGGGGGGGWSGGGGGFSGGGASGGW